MSLGTIYPIRSIVEVDVSASDDEPSLKYRAVYVGTGGNLKIDTPDSTGVTLVALAAGVWHPMEVTKIYNSGTTAEDILGGR